MQEIKKRENDTPFPWVASQSAPLFIVIGLTAYPILTSLQCHEFYELHPSLYHSLVYLILFLVDMKAAPHLQGTSI